MPHIVSRPSTKHDRYSFADRIVSGDSAGGLVIGGYDADAFEPNDVAFNVYVNGSRTLTASLQSLVVTNTLQGQRSMPIAVPEGLNMSIDSTVSQIWLPRDICDTMEEVLGLQFDETRELYLVNTTMHERLLELSPEFTFTLAANSSQSDITTSITLPYAAFDLRVSEPYYDNSTAYFPIRRAPDETQLVLGRTFLQETYVTVDWERGTYNLSQVKHQNGVSSNIVPILPPEEATVVVKKKGLSPGAIAGIVVGIVAVLAILCLTIWLLRRNRRGSTVTLATEEVGPPEKDGYPTDSKHDLSELASPVGELEHKLTEQEGQHELVAPDRHELHDDALRHQLMSNAVYELPGNFTGHEMSAGRDQDAGDT